MQSILAKKDVILTGVPAVGDGTQRTFAMPQGSTLEINWVRHIDDTHLEVEMETPRGDYVRWIAPIEAVNVNGTPPPANATISSQVRAFLDTIAVPEGTSGKDGYRTCFTGVLCVPADFSDHPRIVHCSGRICSDAAGRYQFLSTTWDSVASGLGLKDFSPPNQDLGAVELIRRRGVLDAVEAGDVETACSGTGGTTGVAYEWASLPPGRYGQPSITFDQAKSLFVAAGGKLSS